MYSDLTIIDYGHGNIGSLINMIKKAGYSCNVASTIYDIENANRLILPGVGSFDSGIKSLNNQKYLDVLFDKIKIKKTPILGICLGMQLFFEGSDEGLLKGLALIEGRCEKFIFGTDSIFKVPNMGWLEIDFKKDNEMTRNFDTHPRFYFAHSYHGVCKNQADILAIANYGYDFLAALESENIIGVQFHPEKSHKFGMKVFSNFMKL